jgi:hypothetical protein
MLILRVNHYRKTVFQIVLFSIFQISFLFGTAKSLSKGDPQILNKKHQVRLSSLYNVNHDLHNSISVQSEELKVQTLNGTYSLKSNATSPKKKTKREKKKLKGDILISGI